MPFVSTHDMVIGIVCAVLGCAVLFASLDAARRTRNWLFLVCALGGLVFVLGVAGQRVFPTEDTRRLDPVTANRHTPGPWEAGVQIPVIGVSATPVAVGGFLVAVIGLSLVLFFEAVPDQDAAPLVRPPLPFDDGETV
jgi:uncharacterized membrane protein YeaQ/YmgE (transglycosylase-associated protein family)